MSQTNILRDRRKHLGLTVREVAEYVNTHGSYQVTLPTMSSLEAGRRHASPHLLLLICQALDLDPLPILAERGLIHPLLDQRLRSEAEAQRIALAALGITIP